MNEQQLKKLYELILQRDPSYATDVPYQSFVQKMQDASYTKKMQDWVGVNEFNSVMGATQQPTDLKKKVPATGSSSEDGSLAFQPGTKPPAQQPGFNQQIFPQQPQFVAESTGIKPRVDPLMLQQIQQRKQEEKNKIGFLTPSLDIINEDLINSNEEYVVPQLNYHFGDLGFKFEQSGMTGDWVTVTAPNGKKKEIGLDPFMGFGASGKVNELKNFIKENTMQMQQTSLDKIQQMYSNENKKYASQEQVDTDVKDFSKRAEGVKNEISGFLKEKSMLDAEEAYLKSAPYAERQTEQYLNRLKTAQAKKEQLKTKAQTISERQNSLELEQLRLNAAMGKYTTMKSEQGTWAGGIWNAFLDGAASIASGAANIMTDIIWEGMPTEGTLKGNEQLAYDMAKQNGIAGPKAGQDFMSWYNSLPKTVSQSILDKVQDLGKKAWKYGTEGDEGMLSAIRRGNRVVYGDPTTTVEWSRAKEEGFWGGAILGVAKSLPAMIGGSGWAGAAQRTAQFYTQIADGLNEEMEKNPNFKDVSENEKQLIMGTVGAAGAVLEEFGLRNVVNSKGLMNGLVMRALGKSGAATTAKSFSNFIRQDVESMIARGSLKIVGGVLAEAETGAAQQAAEFGIKDIYGFIKDKKDTDGNYMKMFNTPESFSEWVRDVAVAGAQEAVGGFVLGMPSAVSAAYRSKGFKGMDDKTFVAFEAMANDETLQSAFIADLKAKVTRGEVTGQQAKETLNDYRNSVGLFRALPEGLSLQAKKEAMNLLNERKALEQKIQGKDAALVKPQQARIEQINQELNKLSENAVQEQTTDEGVLGSQQPQVGLQEVVSGNQPQIITGGTSQTIQNAKPQVLTTVENTVAGLNALPSGDKSNITFSNEKGEQVTLNGNEKVASDLYHQAVATPEEQRTSEQQSVIDAIEVSLKTQIDEETRQALAKLETPVVNVAPFFDTQVGNREDANALRESQEYKGFLSTLSDLATKMGLTPQITNKIGGYKNDEGNDITEVSALVSLPGATIEQAEQFAAMSAALAPYVQESSIAAQYTENQAENHNANEYEFQVKPEDVDGAIQSLKEAGILNFTADDSTGVITFTDVKEFADADLIKKINKLIESFKSKNIEFNEDTINYRPIESRFIDKNRRRDAIRKIKAEGSQNGQGGAGLRETLDRAIQQDAAFQGRTVEDYTGEQRPSGPVAGNRLFSKPLSRVKEIANRYYERVFGKSRPQYFGSRKLDEARAKRISDAFIAMKHDPNNPEVRAAYEALAKETIEQYKALVDAGYVIEINNEEPYANSEDMINDLRNNNRIKIFSTESGFGDNPITDEQRAENPLLAKSEFTDKNGLPLLVNDLFRAVHDFFGHAELGNSFGPKGEENAWNVHVRMFSPLAARAMTTETRGQNSYVNFSGVNDQIKALREQARELRQNGASESEVKPIVDKIYELASFAEQKVGLLPEEFSQYDVNDTGDANMSSLSVSNNVNEMMTTDTSNPSNLEKVFNFLDAIDKKISGEIKPDRMNDFSRVLPLGTMQVIVKSLKALVKGGMMLQDAIKKVAADNNVSEQDVISSLTIINNMENNVSEGLSEAELPGYDRMMGEVEGIIKKSKQRGVSEAKIRDNVMKYVMGSKVYETATDVQREKLVRAVNKMFGVREKSAPSIGRILGQIKNLKMVTIAERDLLKKQLKDYEKGAKSVKSAWLKASSELTATLKDYANAGKITIKQMANILRKFSKVNMLNEDSINNFVEYMANVFEDAEYADKINNAKRMLPTARKNVKGKLGAAMNLIPAMQRLFSINPELIPMPVLNSYMLLVDMMGKRQEVLELKDIEVVTMMTNAILDMVEEERSLAQELADRLDYYQDKVLDDDGKVKYADTVAAMLKDGVIDEQEAEIMRKYKSAIMPREAKAEMTEAEIEQKKRELTTNLLATQVNSSTLSSVDDRNKANEIRSLLKPEILKHLDINQLNNLIKVIDNINNGYLPHSAQLMIERLNAINNGSVLAEAVMDAKPLPLSKLYSKLKSMFTGKDAIQEMVRRGPLYFVDQLFGDFKTKRIFDSVFAAAAKGQALFESNVNRINKQIDEIHSKVAKSFNNDSNKTLMSSYKMMAYMIQQEFLSNPESNQVNPAHKFLAETIKFLDKNSREDEANMLQEILDNYTDADGNIDSQELFDSFNDVEIDALSKIREINDSLTDKAVHTAGVIRGSKISPLNNYIHLPVLSDYDPDSSTSATAAADQYNRNLMPSTKGKSLIERTGKVSPLNFDVFASAQQGAKSVLMDYYLTEPVRTARKTLNEAEKMLEANGRIPKEKRQIFSAIKKGFNEATENLLVNNYVSNTFADEVANYITKQGYRAILASVPRFISELTSNVGFALVSDRKSFTTGIKYKDILMTPKAVDIANNVGSKQINRLFHGNTLSGRFIDTSIMSEKTGMKGGKPKGKVSNIVSRVYNNSLKKYKNAVELTADTLISTPDKMVMRPIWFGSFANKFEQVTGEKVDFEKIAENDEAYMSQFKEAIDESTTFADNKSVLAGATDNAFMGILKGTSKPNQTAFLRAFNNFNNFMTRFAIYEYSAARTGVMAMVNKGELSRKQGAALLGGVTTRMVVYTMLTQTLGSVMAKSLSGVGDDDEDEKSLLQKFGQSLTSAATGLLFGRDFGNATRGIVNYGLEEMNEKFLTGLREGEYDAYKDAIAYSIVPPERKGHKTTLADYLSKMGGSFGPALKTADLIVTKMSEEPKKEEGAIQRQEDEISKRIPLEVLGNLGFVPLYKDVRKVAMEKIYGSLKEEKKQEKINKQQKADAEAVQDKSDLEILKTMREEETDPQKRTMIERKMNEMMDESEEVKNARKEKRKADNLLKEKLLEGYDNQSDMKKYDKQKWEQNFGEGSEWYKSHQLENEIEKALDKQRQKIEDEMHDYIPPSKKKYRFGPQEEDKNKNRKKKKGYYFGPQSDYVDEGTVTERHRKWTSWKRIQ